MIYGGPIIFDFSEAAAVLRWYREFQATAPDEFYIFLGLQSVPAGDPFPKEHWNKKICVLLVSHNGSTADAEKAVNAIRAALPKPIIDWAGPMPYPALQSMFDGTYPKGLQWYWKGDFVKTLPDAAINARLAHAANVPSAVSCMHLYPIDGAVHRRKPDAIAWNCRDATWSLVIVEVDPDPTKAPAIRKWAHRLFWSAVHPFDLPGGYANFMMDDEGEGESQGHLWRQLRPACERQEAIRPGEPLPCEPEHTAGCLTCNGRPNAPLRRRPPGAAKNPLRSWLWLRIATH